MGAYPLKRLSTCEYALKACFMSRCSGHLTPRRGKPSNNHSAYGPHSKTAVQAL